MVDIKKNVDHKNNYGQFTDPASPPCMFYGLWEKAGEPAFSQTPVDTSRTCKLHQKGPRVRNEPTTFFMWRILLTTAPLPYLDNVQ